MENDTFKYVKGVLYNKYYRSPNSLEGQEAGYTNSKGYKVDKTKIYLGRFNTQEEARNAYIEAKKRFHVIQEDETVLKELEKEVDKSQ